jgi:hypothetical protein
MLCRLPLSLSERGRLSRRRQSPAEKGDNAQTTQGMVEQETAGDLREGDPRYPLLQREREPYRQPATYEETSNTSYDSSSGYYPPPPQVYAADMTSTRRRNIIILVIIIAIVVAIAVGVLVYFLFFRAKAPTTNNNTASGGSLDEACSATAPCLVLFSCDASVCKSVLNGPCLTNADCSQAQFTSVCTGTGGQGGECRRALGVACNLGAQCASGFCSLGGICATCVTGDDCNEQTCREQPIVCSSCTINSDCPTGQHCLPTNECSTGGSCLAGVCQ